jgi:hypothetical protein
MDRISQALQRSDISEKVLEEKYFKEKVFVEKVQIVKTIFKESIASPTANSVSITLI